MLGFLYNNHVRYGGTERVMCLEIECSMFNIKCSMFINTASVVVLVKLLRIDHQASSSLVLARRHQTHPKLTKSK